MAFVMHLFFRWGGGGGLMKDSPLHIRQGWGCRVFDY